MKRLSYNRRFAYALVWLLLYYLLIASELQIPIADDVAFLQHIENHGGGLKGALSFWMQYQRTWSTRWLIELLYIPLYTFPGYMWVFRASFALSFILIGDSLVRIVDPKDDRAAAMIAAFPVLIQLWVFGDAGWIATGANYLWPMAALMYSVVVLCDGIRQCDVSRTRYLVGGTAFILAVNNMQIAALTFGMLICLLPLALRRSGENASAGKPVIKYMIYGLLMASLHLAWHILSPATVSRGQIEVRWWKTFPMQNVTDKFLDGFFFSTNCLFSMPQGIGFCLMSILLTVAIMQKCKDKNLRRLAWFQLFITLGFGILKPVILNIFPSFHKFYLSSIEATHTTLIYPWLMLALQIGLVAIIGILIWHVFHCGIKGALLALVWLGGVCTQVMLGFSPTLYASGMRTSAVMLMCIIVLCAFLIKKVLVQWKGNRSEETILVPVGMLVFLSAIHQFCIL